MTQFTSKINNVLIYWALTKCDIEDLGKNYLPWRRNAPRTFFSGTGLYLTINANLTGFRRNQTKLF